MISPCGLPTITYQEEVIVGYFEIIIVKLC